MSTHVTSRRALLATLAGAAATGTNLLRGSSLRHRSLVSIRIPNGADAQAMVQTGLLGVTWNSSLSYVERQYSAGAAAVMEESLEVAERGYLANGFSVPAWMLRAAGAGISESASRAYTFASGVVMLTPDGLHLEGAQFQNPLLVSQASRGVDASSLSSVGLQLAQVANLLAAHPEVRTMFSVSLGFDSGIGSVARQRDNRMGKLDQALRAFHRSLSSAGMAPDVTVFTDADATASGKATRLVLGGAVMDGSLRGGSVHPVAARLQAGRTFAAWAGYSPVAFSSIS
jgi:hypothetical protein